MWNIGMIATAALVLFGIQFANRYIRARRLKYWFEKGMTQYRARQFEPALNAFQKCVRIAPEWLHARTLMSISLAQTGQKERALQEIEMVRALQPREAETWTLITTFYVFCMPDDDARLLEALEQLAAIDSAAASTLMGQPAFTRYRHTPAFKALKEKLDPVR